MNFDGLSMLCHSLLRQVVRSNIHFTRRAEISCLALINLWSLAVRVALTRYSCLNFPVMLCACHLYRKWSVYLQNERLEWWCNYVALYMHRPFFLFILCWRCWGEHSDIDNRKEKGNWKREKNTKYERGGMRQEHKKL